MSTASVPRITLILFAVAACILIALPALADSQVRIVRLSDVQGSVQIDKNGGLGFENAFVNLPVVQGAQLRTRGGRAEVEFEDGSSLRLAPNTLVEFAKLGADDSGKRISHINVVEGMAYVDWLGKDGLTVDFSRETASIDHAAHFRVDTSSNLSSLAIFKGDLEVEGPSGKFALEKKKTATFNGAEDDKYTIANKIQEDPLDSWDKNAISYHDQYAKNNSSPYGYGVSDLNYYGSYSNVPGYGMMWQPFFTGVGWDPFMDGVWGFYPGFGYMFASAYPWGWMPYRYGNWMLIPGMGWMWQPGGWNMWAPIPRYTATTGAHVTSLVAPTGTTKTVAVGRGGVGTSTMLSSRFVVNSGSAGIGIPRGSLGNLSHLNHQVAKSGFAEVRPAPQFSSVSHSASYGTGASRGSMAGPSGSMGHASPAGHTSSGGGGSHH